MKVFFHTALLSVLLGTAPLAVAKSPTLVSGGQQCSSQTQTATYTAGQLKQSGLATILNGYFGPGGRATNGKIVPSNDTIVPANTEVLTLTVASKSCRAVGNGRSRLQASGSSTKDFTCVELGCVDGLGPSFNGLGVGSTVKMTTCGEGVETHRTYLRASNGSWTLARYESILKDQCTIS